jgi:hypothetical protein
MRGTLHFTSAEDLRWMLAYLTPRVISASAARIRQLGLDHAVFRRSRRVMERALAGGRALTRSAVYGVLEDAGISTAGQRGIHILWRIAQEGAICFGTLQGKQHTFVLLDEWLPAGKVPPRDEALSRLALRYFTGHGPATLRDFAWWSGLTAAEARAGLEAGRGHLARYSIEGEDFWEAPGAPPGGSSRGVVRLLPPFDEYLVGYNDRRAALDPAHAPRVASLLSPTILLGGRVVGTWKRVRQKDRVRILASPFDRLGKQDLSALERAAARYGEFLGTPVTLG